MSPQKTTFLAMLCLLPLFFWSVRGWTGEIRGRVVCDVCGDSSLGPEDHTLEGAEVAVLCITKSGEVLNYQAFTNSKGVYKVAETMPESERWDGCLARPISSFSEHCSHLGRGTAGVKFSYNHPSGYFHTVRPFIYKPVNAPAYYKLMVAGGSALADAINQLKFMSFLILSGQPCPPGIEWTLFALFMSIDNLGSTIGSFLGAGLASLLNISSGSLDNLLLGISIQAACILITAAFLFLIPKEAAGIST